MKRTAFARWEGGFKEGRGSFTLQNGGLCDVPVSYHSRFEGETAISPEGLLAAAHAASFAMSFAKHLESNELTAERVDTVATVNVEIVRGLETITCVDLELVVHTASSKHNSFREAANRAKTDCSISLLINAEITLKTTIKGATHFSVA